jgi:chemotaxis protein MotA
MLSIIGIVVVIGAIVGGYLMEHGSLAVLVQPAELLIIGGAAIGTLLIANPMLVLSALLKDAAALFKGDIYNKDRYLKTLQMLNDLFSHARRGGIASLEPDVEDPQKSQLFKKHGFILSDHYALDFICDTLRVAMTGTVSHFDLDQMIELDLEVHHWEANAPVAALSTVADALPGLGIVAAVLGVVITMQSIGGPPAEVGHKVAAALVGTFLGILLCYGLFGPMAAAMTRSNEIKSQYFNCLRTGLIAFVRGAPPILAVEFSRRSVPVAVRPSFLEMEKSCKGLRPAEPAVEAEKPAAKTS